MIHPRALAMLGILAAPMAWAQAGPSSLDLDHAVKQALEANFDLQGQDIRTRMKKRDRDLAYNRLYPTATVGVTHATLNDPAASAQVAGVSSVPTAHAIVVTPDANNLLLNLTVQETLSVAAFRAIDQTKTDYQNGLIAERQMRSEVVKSVKKLFYQLLAAQETVRVAESQLSNAERRLADAQKSLAAGQASELTMLQARVLRDNRRPAVDEARVAYHQMLFTFENLLGLDGNPNLRLEGNLEVTQNMGNLEGSLDGRLDVLAARGRIQAAQDQLALQESLQLPTLTLQYSADPGLNNPWSSSTDWGKPWHQKSGALSVTLGWKLDSFLPGSSFANQRDDLADQVRLAQVGLAQTRRNAQTEAAVLAEKLLKSLGALKNLEASVAAAQRAAELTRNAFQTGTRSALEVQDAELQELTAQLNLLNEKAVFHSNWIDWQAAHGKEDSYGNE